MEEVRPMSPQTKPHILLIDDQPKVLVPLVSLLESGQFRVSLAIYEKRLPKIFRARLGTTVFAYVRTARLRLARRLLRNDQISLEEVAAQTGFRSASNVSTALRAVEGISPREYRRINDASLKDSYFSS